MHLPDNKELPPSAGGGLHFTVMGELAPGVRGAPATSAAGDAQEVVRAQTEQLREPTPTAHPPATRVFVSVREVISHVKH